MMKIRRIVDSYNILRFTCFIFITFRLAFRFACNEKKCEPVLHDFTKICIIQAFTASTATEEVNTINVSTQPETESHALKSENYDDTAIA